MCSHTFPPFLGILQGVFYGLGNGGGTVLSGHLYEAIGAQSTFQYFAVSSLVVLFILLIAFPVFDSCMFKQCGHEGEAEYELVPSDEMEDSLESNDKDKQNELE